MNHEVNVVQQYPVGLVVALDVGRADSGLSESLLYLIRDGLNLPRVATRADNEVIGECSGGLIHLQNGDFLGLFGFGCLYGFHHLGHGWVLFGHSSLLIRVVSYEFSVSSSLPFLAYDVGFRCHASTSCCFRLCLIQARFTDVLGHFRSY